MFANAIIYLSSFLSGYFVSYYFDNPQKCEHFFTEFKKETKKKITDIAYNIVYAYSVTEIQVKKVFVIFEKNHKDFVEMMDAFYYTLFGLASIFLGYETEEEEEKEENNKNNSFLEFVKSDGSVSHLLFSDYIHKLPKKDEYDFIIYSDLSSLPVNKVLYNSLPENFEYTVHSDKFLSTILHYNDDTIDIALKTDSYNYYVLDNMFLPSFWRYFYRKHKNVDADLDKYKLEIIDGSINVYIMDQTHGFFLRNDSLDLFQYFSLQDVSITGKISEHIVFPDLDEYDDLPDLISMEAIPGSEETDSLSDFIPDPEPETKENDKYQKNKERKYFEYEHVEIPRMTDEYYKPNIEDDLAYYR
jgi:hypothetical protein